MKKSYPSKVLVSLVAGLTFLAGPGPDTQLYGAEKDEGEISYRELYDKLDIFTDALTIVERSYVEDVDYKKLVYGALHGTLTSLDDHSAFLEPEDFEDMQVETEGEFGGLGVEITIKNRYLTVVTPLADTPAEKAGLLPGDRVIKIDGETTEDITLSQSVKKLRGSPGTDVELAIARQGERGLIDVTITREIIRIDSVKDARIIDKDVGYLRVTQFQEHTVEDMDREMERLTEEGMKGFVLDLRNNPGGLLQEAIDMADRFLGNNKLVVYTKGRMPEQSVEFSARGGPPMYAFPVIILVNKGSASGSEIVAGALQDWGRAIILGSTSFGKGSVQSLLPLKDGAALKLTTANYYTPEGRSITEKGIEPDIVVEVERTDEIKLKLARLHKLDQSGTKLVPRAEEIEDVQLQRAVHLLKGFAIMSGEKVALSPKEESEGEEEEVKEE